MLISWLYFTAFNIYKIKSLAILFSHFPFHLSFSLIIVENKKSRENAIYAFTPANRGGDAETLSPEAGHGQEIHHIDAVYLFVRRKRQNQLSEKRPWREHGTNQWIWTVIYVDEARDPCLPSSLGRILVVPISKSKLRRSLKVGRLGKNVITLRMAPVVLLIVTVYWLHLADGWRSKPNNHRAPQRQVHTGHIYSNATRGAERMH